MGKEFECLYRIDKRNYLTEREHKEFLGVVEKALTEYETIKNAEPTKAMECLEEISSLNVVVGKTKRYDISTPLGNYLKCEITTIKQALLKAQKERKALEIIKEKRVDIELLKESNDRYEYNTHFPYREVYHLTEEEFNLLKEVLK